MADNLDAADRMIGAAIDALVAFPDRGHKRPVSTPRNTANSTVTQAHILTRVTLWVSRMS